MPENASIRIHIQIGFTFPLACMFHMLSHWAYVIILFPVVVKVLYDKSIFLPGSLLLCVEIIVLDKSLYTSILHKLIVLFASITGIGHYYRRLSIINLLKIFQKRNKSCCISGSPLNPQIDNELVLCSNLYRWASIARFSYDPLSCA